MSETAKIVPLPGGKHQTVPTIKTIFNPKANNFDLLRICAAIAVILSHSIGQSGGTFEPFSYYTSYGSAGGIAVAVFFVTSGFLVTRSLERRTTLEYVLARALRILPLLAVVTLTEATIIGPIFYYDTLHGYFNSPGFRSHFENMSVFYMHLNIPGVFNDLPMSAMNGPLWSLPVECAMYVALPFAAPLLFQSRWGSAILLAVSASATIAAYHFGYSWGAQGPMLFNSVTLYTGLSMSILFLSGSVLWRWRDAIQMNGGFAALCCVLLFAANGTAASSAAYHIAIPYLTLYLATAGAIGTKLKDKFGDLSYSTYLLGWPIAQCVVAIWHPSAGIVMLTTLAVVIPLAWASWRYVEAPALRLLLR